VCFDAKVPYCAAMFCLISIHKYIRRRVNMRGTIWKDANLSRANLFGSFAKGAIFTGADLTNADLEVLQYILSVQM
jgi:uncharacterized protein YjbI with pentapeptide repeats